MTRNSKLWKLLAAFALASVVGCTSTRHASAKMEHVVVEKQGFVLEKSRTTFRPLGFNYGNAGRLMEDFWDEDWKTFADDFAEMKKLGANVVRVHLQVGKFMKSADEPNAASFKQLKRMVRLAEDAGLYLDVTGLACYRPSDTPKWYDALAEKERWAAQSNFWREVAATCAGSPAIFCYDLINEPLSPANKREAGQWRSGSNFGGFDFLQVIALDPSGRKREDIPVAWIRAMTGAIRSRDTNTLITVGMLPWSRQWKHMSGFVPEKVAPELDFISVHIYPDSKKPGEEMECLQKFAVGKPVVIEETFALSCTPEELATFIRESRTIACGWIGHYDGQPLWEADALERAGNLTLHGSIYRSWQRIVADLAKELPAK